MNIPPAGVFSLSVPHAANEFDILLTCVPGSWRRGCCQLEQERLFEEAMVERRPDSTNKSRKQPE